MRAVGASGGVAARRLDVIAVVLLAAGLLCVGAGLLEVRDALDTLERVLPLLVFLGAVVVLAELTAKAEVFEVVASRIAHLGRGSYLRLFGATVALASVTTIVLNLDTTAILLTPVMLALAARAGIAPVPLAVTTVWLANTSSLLLPVSNLTNLLALDKAGLTTSAFAARMLLPQLAALAVTMAGLWWFYWRPVAVGSAGYGPVELHRPQDPALCALGAGACGLFLAGVVGGVPLGGVAGVAALLLVVAFAVRDRGSLRPGILPWRLLVMVTGLFLVIQTLGVHGLDDLAATLAGSGEGAVGSLRIAGVGAALSNAVNNLPAYVAVESTLSAGGGPEPVLALLVGANVGPIVTPWASLATLLWYERCLAHGVELQLPRLMWTGACVALGCLVGASLALGI